MCARVKSRYISLYAIWSSHLQTGNPSNGYVNPYYWVDDRPLSYGNNGSLDPSNAAYVICLLKHPTNHGSVPRLRTTRKKSTNLSLEWITCLPSQKKGQNCPQKTYSFDLLFPQKTEMTKEKPKHFVQISITLLTKTTILSAFLLTVIVFPSSHAVQSLNDAYLRWSHTSWDLDVWAAPAPW